jgi:hypothetical protein
MSGVALSNVANILIIMILDDLCPLLQLTKATEFAIYMTARMTGGNTRDSGD